MRPPEKRGSRQGQAGGFGYSSERTEADDLGQQYSRSCAHCQIAMPHARAWHRLCWQCYRLAKVDDHIRQALHLLREIQSRDGVRR